MSTSLLLSVTTQRRQDSACLRQKHYYVEALPHVRNGDRLVFRSGKLGLARDEGTT